MKGKTLLQKYLRETGQRQSDLVKAGPFDDGLVSRWLSGQRVPPLRHAVRLEQLTGVPASAWV